jgi:cytochrome P450
MTDTIAAKTSVAPSYNLSIFEEGPTTIDAARRIVDATPIEQVDVANPKLFHNDVIGPYFERLRREDPVHYAVNPVYGGYWSITKYNDIMAIDTNHKQFSSEAGLGGITIFGDGKEPLPMFIAMDPPKHDVQRKAVTPIVSPTNLKVLEPLIRERAAKILDALPIGVEFDWVDKVSIELTAMTLATLFDFPQEAPQAHALVGRRDRGARRRHHRKSRAMGRRDDGVLRDVSANVVRARGAATDRRSDLDARSRR